jgi:hypothetical protein
VGRIISKLNGTTAPSRMPPSRNGVIDLTLRLPWQGGRGYRRLATSAATSASRIPRDVGPALPPPGPAPAATPQPPPLASSSIKPPHPTFCFHCELYDANVFAQSAEVTASANWRVVRGGSLHSRGTYTSRRRRARRTGSSTLHPHRAETCCGRDPRAPARASRPRACPGCWWRAGFDPRPSRSSSARIE